MKDRDERVEAKIDKLVEDVGNINVTLAAQHEVLKIHEARSTKLEAIVLPIHNKVTMVEGALKFVGLLGILATVVKAIAMLFGK